MSELYRDPITAIEDTLAGDPNVSLVPTRQPFGRILYKRNTRQFWMRVGGPVGVGPFTGVAVWELMGGPGAALGWPKYVVNVAGQQPVTPYQSIQAAIDDAVVDGHGFANPTQVLVFPGTYTETVTAEIGIHIVGFEGCEPRDTVIAGQLVIAPGAAVVGGSLRIANMDIRPSAKPATVISGVGRAAVLLSNCSILGDGREAVTTSNTNVASELILRGCICAKVGAVLAAGTALVRATVGVIGPLILEDGCQVTVDKTTEKAVQSAAFNGTRINGSKIIGRILIQSNSAEVEDCNLTVDAQAAIDLDTASLILTDCTILHTGGVNPGGPTVGGVGSTATYGNVTWLSDRRTAAGVLTQAVRQRGPIPILEISVDTTSNQIEDLVVVDVPIGGPGVTYTLPNLDTVFDGDTTRIVVRSSGPVFGLTVATAVGDFLDLGSNVLLVFPIHAFDRLEYRAQPALNNWVRMA